MIDLPVNFDELVKMPSGTGGTGYPYQISAKDLMKSFHYAALDVDDSWIDSPATSYGQGRKLKLPAVPSDGETQNLWLFLRRCRGDSSAGGGRGERAGRRPRPTFSGSVSAI